MNLIGQNLLNQYRVESFVASGGMGAVYRVWDTKRNVPLAMKVLHADLADDPTALKRFQREALALKKLSHPNIVPFYGLYEVGDFVFMLERFVDGPSLKDLLRQLQGKPLLPDQALIYLNALAAGLGYAHVGKVVHCDVKPGNVMIDRGGNIYLTDFGIARHADSATTTLGVAGTPAYMAPEQIRGEIVSAATDVYALGVLFFELITAQRPFRGAESASTAGGTTVNERIRYEHLHISAPDPCSINPALPRSLSAVVLRALNKDPRERYQTTREFFLAACGALNIAPEIVPDRVSPLAVASYPVQSPAPSSRSVATPVPISQAQPENLPIRQGFSMAWAGAAFGLLACGTLTAILFMNMLGGGATPSATEPGNVSVGANFSGASDPNAGAHEPVSLPADTPVAAPIFTSTTEPTFPPPSTDLPTPSATPQPSDTPIPTAILPTPAPAGPTGKIVYTCQVRGEGKDQICIMRADGTNNRQLTNDNSENYYPSLAPDGNSVVFVSNRSGRFEIYELNLGNNSLAQLTNGIGEPAAPEISPNGKRIIFANNKNQYARIWIMARDGSNPREVYGYKGRDALDPVWSPDGKRILFALGVGEQKQLHIINPDSTNLEKITSSVATRGRSDWSPDGRFVATYSGESWHREIFLINADGSGAQQISNGGNVLAPSFSPDSLWIAFTGYIDRYGDGNGCEIYIMRIDGSDVRRLTDNDICDYQSRWGP